MSTLAALLKGTQAFAAFQMPTTVKIGAQSYAAAVSGRRFQTEDGPGGFEIHPAISFWLPASAFTAAGQPVPEARGRLTCSAPARLAGNYLIEAVLADGPAATVLLRCVALPE